MNHVCFLSIGSNLGDKILYINNAISRLSFFCDIIKTSSFYYTESWGYKDDHYINCVLKIKTSLNPVLLLKALINIEKEMGRIENTTKQYKARQIDLDILFLGSLFLDKLITFIKCSISSNCSFLIFLSIKFKGFLGVLTDISRFSLTVRFSKTLGL